MVIGPLGEPLTLESLPPRDTKRWVVRRKAEVVAAVTGGLLTIAEACERYDLTLEEFISWQRAVGRSGIPGLRVTRIQHYRSAEHTSELQSLMRISYAVFCLKKKPRTAWQLKRQINNQKMQTTNGPHTE